MTTVTSLGYTVFAKSVLSFFFSQSYKFKSVIAVNRIQFATVTIMYVEDIIAAFRKVMDGDEEALQQLGLDNVSYPLPKPTDTSLDRLQVNYTCALNITVAVRELQFSLIEDQCKIAMRLMQTIAQDRGMHLQHNVDSQDVAEVMLALIDQEQQHLKAMHPERSDIAGSDSEAEEQQGEANDVTPLPPAAVTKPSDVSESTDSKPRDTAPLPPPQSYSYSSSDDELVEVFLPKSSSGAVQSTPSAATPPVRMTTVATPPRLQ